MFKLVADELAADITAVRYDFEEYYKFGDKLLELPFPVLVPRLVIFFAQIVGRPPVPFFTMDRPMKSKHGGARTKEMPLLTLPLELVNTGSKTEWFRYFGRQALKVIYDDVMSLRLRGHFSMYYIHEALGYGKSYILVALAIRLMQQERKVVYLPDCRRLAR